MFHTQALIAHKHQQQVLVPPSHRTWCDLVSKWKDILIFTTTLVVIVMKKCKVELNLIPVKVQVTDSSIAQLSVAEI